MVVITTQRSLQKLEKKFFDPQWLRPVLDDVAHGFLLETSERIVYINRAYAAFLQYRPQEVVTRDISFFIAQEDASRLLQYSRRRASHKAAPDAYEFIARRKDDTPVRIEATVTVSLVEHRVMIAAIARPAAAQPAVPHVTVPHPLTQTLSPRELEVMEAILAGKRIKEVAAALNVDARTVATHRARMLAKLQIADNRELFQFAVRHRLVQWE